MRIKFSAAALVLLIAAVQAVTAQETEGEKALREAFQEKYDQADAFYESGDFDQAVVIWEDLAKRVDEELGPGTHLAIDYRNSLALAYRAKGEWIRAHALQEENFEKIRTALGPEHPHTLILMRNLASIRRTLGDLAGAHKLGEEALAISERVLSQDDQSLWNAKGNLAVTLKEQGEIARALALEEEVLAARRRLLGDDHSYTLIAMSNLATTFDMQGRTAEARRLAEEVLDARLRLSGRRHANTLTAMANLANYLRQEGNLDRANEMQADALLAYQEFYGERHPETIRATTGLAAILAEKGNLRMARRLEERAYSVWRDTGGAGHPQTIRIAHNLGLTYKDLGDDAAALALYEEVVNALRQLGDDAAQTTEVIGIFTAYARLLQKKGRTDEAALFFDKALAGVEDATLKADVTSDVRGLYRAHYGEIYRDALVNALDRGQPAEAFALAERLRAQSLRAEIVAERLGRVAVPRPLDEARREVALQYDAVSRRLDALEIDEPEAEGLRRRQRELRRRRDVINAEIRGAVLGEDWQPPAPLNLAAARRTLDPGTLLLAYVSCHDETVLFTLPSGGTLQVHRLPHGRESVESQVRNFTQLIREEAADGQLRLAGWLREALISPASEEVTASERLLVVPDGALHGLPFAALAKLAEDGKARYLVEDKPIHVAASLSIYADLRDRRGRRPVEGRLELVAFGDPSYPNESARMPGVMRSAIERGQMRNLERLVYSEREVVEISRLFPSDQAVVHLRDGAREETVKAAAGRARILHFATHGLNDLEVPGDSFLALSVPDHPAVNGENGALQAWEILQDLRLDADLVVLSACATGQGQYLDGEGPLSLGRAFLSAGARTVVTSLWNVNDRSTADLMIRFYQHLREGASKDEALRAAQLELLHDPDGEGASPRDWAAFQVVGDWR